MEGVYFWQCGEDGELVDLQLLRDVWRTATDVQVVVLDRRQREREEVRYSTPPAHWWFELVKVSGSLVHRLCK